MLEYGMPFGYALSLIKKKRQRVNPNIGFRRQLAEFDKKLRKLRAAGHLPKPEKKKPDDADVISITSDNEVEIVGKSMTKEVPIGKRYQLNLSHDEYF